MTCQWPYGEPKDRNFCGMPGYPWCDLHRKKVYRPVGEVNTYGIATEKRGGSKPRPDSLAGKIRQAVQDNPNTSVRQLAEQLGCSEHHVRHVRRQTIGLCSERSKAASIRKELENGLNPQQIAEKLGCNDAYVRAVRVRMKEIIQ